MKYLYLFLILSINQGFAQVRMTGQILDLQNNPIQGSTIDVVGANSNGISDSAGVFFLTLPTNIQKGDLITLRISKLGYKTVTKHLSVSYLSFSIRLLKDLKEKVKTPENAVVQQSPPQTSTTTENQPNNVNSYFQTGGITAGQVIIAPPNRKLDQTNSTQLLNNLPDKNEKIDVTCVWGDSDSFQFATQILDFLKAQGYKSVEGVTQAMYTRPVLGQNIIRDTTGVKIIIGARQ
jgi:hypothetical protein